MSLFGALFNKEPQEVKAFWNAFGNLTNKMNQKNFDALAQAAQACPDIWQGPFLLGLAMELPCPAISYDAEKANSYHYQAQQLAKNTADAAWVNGFYSWYRNPAINRHKEYTREELALRRLGVAAMNNYEHKNPVVSRHDNNDDAKFWSKLFWSCQSSEAEPFRDLFGNWKSYNGGKASHDTMEAYTLDLIKKTNKCVKQANKCAKKENSGKELSDHDLSGVRDMYPYITGYSLLTPSPYLLEEWGAVKEVGSEPVEGVVQLISAARVGNGPAAHFLSHVLFSNDGEIREIGRRGFSAADASVEDLKLWLLSAAQLGDSFAQELLNQYFHEEN